MARLRGVHGYELSNNLTMAGGVTSGFTRDTTTFSPRGGVASMQCAQTATSQESLPPQTWNTTTLAGTATWLAAGEKGGAGFDFYTGATPTSEDAFICGFRISGGTARQLNLMWEQSGGTLHWYGGGTTAGAGKGTSIGSSGTRVLAQNTWYRMWVYFEFTSGTGTMVCKAWVGDITAEQLTFDCSGSEANTSNMAANFRICGQISSVTAPGATTYIDNLTIWDQVVDGEIKDCVVIRGLVTGNGSTQTWTPSTGSDHAVLVDELPENGSGTTDSDYVGHTVDGDEFFDITFDAFPNGHQTPKGLVEYVWWRNATGSKWGSHNLTATFAGTTVDGSMSIADPGTSYGRGFQAYLRGSDANSIQLTDLTGLELGADHGADAADIRLSTLACEVALEKFQAGAY